MALARNSDSEEHLHSTFASRYVRAVIPRFKMPDNSMPKDAAYQVISDELMLDGNPRLNLASFVTTWMEPECDKLIMESVNKNYVDMDEYPVTTELQNRCVNMIANLFHAPLSKGNGNRGEELKGLPTDNPNIVTGANVQVCWEKFARYFEVELKEVKLSEGYYVMDPAKAVEMVDENTICVAAILGSTLTGEFEDVKTLNDLLAEKNAETGWDVSIHVDSASGGFIAPFLYPDLEWDFRLPWVKSINVSGHKYGLVYAGVGSSQIIAQYYQFIRLGFEGYKNIMENCMDNARRLREGIEMTGKFNIVSKDIGVPLVAFSLKDSSKHTVFEIAESLRKFGWIIPAYTMPADAQHIAVLRVVIREDFSRGLADRLITHILQVLKEIEGLPSRIAHIAAAAKVSGGEEKTAKMSLEDIAKYWKRLVENKRNIVC
ncbi:hypothetical protein Bca101_089241 [Brassica carinata]